VGIISTEKTRTTKAAVRATCSSLTPFSPDTVLPPNKSTGESFTFTIARAVILSPHLRAKDPFYLTGKTGRGSARICLSHAALARVAVQRKERNAGVLRPEVRAQDDNPYAGAISGARLMRISVKKSASSLLRVENSETIATFGPAWNQRVATVSEFLTVGFSHAEYPNDDYV